VALKRAEASFLSSAQASSINRYLGRAGSEDWMLETMKFIATRRKAAWRSG